MLSQLTPLPCRLPKPLPLFLLPLPHRPTPPPLKSSLSFPCPVAFLLISLPPCRAPLPPSSHLHRRLSPLPLAAPSHRFTLPSPSPAPSHSSSLCLPTARPFLPLLTHAIASFPSPQPHRAVASLLPLLPLSHHIPPLSTSPPCAPSSLFSPTLSQHPLSASPPLPYPPPLTCTAVGGEARGGGCVAAGEKEATEEATQGLQAKREVERASAERATSEAMLTIERCQGLASSTSLALVLFKTQPMGNLHIRVLSRLSLTLHLCRLTIVI